MTRALFLLFALAAYLLFFATFLYLIGFVADLPELPRTVDRGRGAAPFEVAAVVDVGLIALFGVQHSVMARAGFKRRWTRIVPEPIERSAYVLAASLALILLFALWLPIPALVWRIDGALASSILVLLGAMGWIVVLVSTFLISHLELFGLAQPWRHARGRAPVPPGFRTPLLYRWVRHPLYSGFLLAFWSTPDMTAGHLLLAVGMTAYILVAIRHEERDLVALFGPRYQRYQREVGKLAPRLGRVPHRG